MTTPSSIDPVDFAAALIKRPSVTPADAGALDTLQRELENLGFACTRYPFGEGHEGPNARVDNLYARLGTAAPNFCFAGHTDVVPAGDTAKWVQNPFAGQVENGQIFGRGAADMKGAIAAFVGALSELLSSGWTPEGSISFLITGDEEGPALNGTKKLLFAIEQAGEKIDHCLVGEPTNPNKWVRWSRTDGAGPLMPTLRLQASKAMLPIRTLQLILSRHCSVFLERCNRVF